MALSDGSMTLAQLEQSMLEHARLEKQLREERERELARASQPRTYVDGKTTWVYSVIDGAFARVDGYEGDGGRIVIPDEIDGFAVLAIGEAAFACDEHVEEIVCPAAVSSIGPGAFRLCSSLKALTLPAHVGEFDPGWLERCYALERLALPGRLERVPASVFASGHLRHLAIGPSAFAIEPGAFERSALQTISVDSSNPHMTTDGTGLYSADGMDLLCIVRQVVRYAVWEGCLRVMPKAAYGLKALEGIDLPSSVERIGELAFARSGLRSFKAPEGLRAIGPRAFYGCSALADVGLNEGLHEVGDSTFEGSGLRELSIPASVQRIGRSVAARTHIAFSGPEPTFTVASASRFFTDGEGGLYESGSEGQTLIQMLDESVTDYHVLDGTRIVAERAFLRNSSIERVIMPNTVVEIGDEAFKKCRQLNEASLPGSLMRLGKEALSGTGIGEVRIPSALVSVGEGAFVTAGACGAEPVPPLRAIEVSPDNGSFFCKDGLLCEHVTGGTRVIAFDNAHDSVRFPEDVVSVAPYALHNARGIRELWLNAHLMDVGRGGLALWSGLERLHVSLAEPVEERRDFHFAFPRTTDAVRAISTALGGSDFVNVREIARLCDKSIMTCHSYARAVKGEPSAYEQALLIAGRLADPVLLEESDRALFEQTLEQHIEEICVDIARHDDRKALDCMADLGFLCGDNIEQIITAVGRLQDAAMTAHLLGMRRRLFKHDPFDFEI